MRKLQVKIWDTQHLNKEAATSRSAVLGFADKHCKDQQKRAFESDVMR
jgi:hypothetical protein